MKISNLPAKISGAFLAAGAYLASTGTAYAQFNAGQIQAVPVLGNSFKLTQVITWVVNSALILIGIVAVVYLIWGGVTYVTAGGDAEKAGKGRVAITNAIIGIIIIIAAMVIYNAVIAATLNEPF